MPKPDPKLNTHPVFNPDKILCNKMITPDGTILESRNRHDYRSYTDKNGKWYMLDGGLDYRRASCNGDENFITVTHSSPHKLKRENIHWGKSTGFLQYDYILLKDLSDDHIENILRTQTHIFPELRDTFIDEQVFRECEGIVIND